MREARHFLGPVLPREYALDRRPRGREPQLKLYSGPPTWDRAYRLSAGVSVLLRVGSDKSGLITPLPFATPRRAAGQGERYDFGRDELDEVEQGFAPAVEQALEEAFGKAAARG